jgi:hypothetical protein
MDSHEHSVLRLVSSDPVKTKQVLESLNVSHAESDVLMVELKNQPARGHLCEQPPPARQHRLRLLQLRRRNGRVFGIFKVSDITKAMRPGRQQRASRRRASAPADRRAYSAGRKGR